jgi:RimJ/RimL family protein N-acetyltransferase
LYNHKNGIVLRKLERKNLPLLKELKNESWFGTHTINFVNDDDQERWFNSLNPNKDLILIANSTPVLKTQQPARGLFKINNIDWVNRKCTEGHDTFIDQRGYGYGKLIVEAGTDFIFEILNMNRIECEILENNIASQKCCEYVGYTKEGVKRKAIHKCGQYIDSYCYGILFEEWKESARVKDLYNGICNKSYQPLNTK